MAIEIHPDLHALIPPLTEQEYGQLEANICAEGCRDALIVWQEQQTIIDGHNRYAICQKHGLSYTTREVSLLDLDAARAYMLRLQLGRRNLTPEQLAYLRGKQYQGEKKGEGRPENNGQKISPLRTAEKLAEEHHVTHQTIKNDAAFATAVDTITAVIPEAKHAILARDATLGRQEVKQLASIASNNAQTAKNVLAQIQEAATPRAAKKIVREASREVSRQTPKEQSKPVSIVEQAPLPPPRLSLDLQEQTAKNGLETIHATDGREMFILHNPESKPVFNKTNEMVDWASWTWNPVTGCWHGCDYCYAREIANSERMATAYPKKFEPTFHPARLNAPANTSVPKVLERPADKNVFTCSMADLFGKWVPDEWITQVFDRVQVHQEWNFLFLTKFPQRLRNVCDKIGGFPDNAWVGCTVDSQARVASAERAFAGMKAKVRWLSVEPMRERLTFTHLDYFDWLVIGGQTASYFNNTPAGQPEWEWVEHLWNQARAAKIAIYWKENLTIRPKEVPWERIDK